MYLLEVDVAFGLIFLKSRKLFPLSSWSHVYKIQFAATRCSGLNTGTVPVKHLGTYQTSSHLFDYWITICKALVNKLQPGPITNLVIYRNPNYCFIEFVSLLNLFTKYKTFTTVVSNQVQTLASLVWCGICAKITHGLGSKATHGLEKPEIDACDNNVWVTRVQLSNFVTRVENFRTSLACNSCQNEKRLHCVYIFILLYFLFFYFLFRVKREKFRNNWVINRENRHCGTLHLE